VSRDPVCLTGIVCFVVYSRYVSKSKAEFLSTTAGPVASGPASLLPEMSLVEEIIYKDASPDLCDVIERICETENVSREAALTCFTCGASPPKGTCYLEGRIGRVY
jgi:hypothetical protein